MRAPISPCEDGTTIGARALGGAFVAPIGFRQNPQTSFDATFASHDVFYLNLLVLSKVDISGFCMTRSRARVVAPRAPANTN